jgi:glycine dehydrogenase subunit 2
MRNTQATKLIFELSQPGRSGVCIAASDVPQQDPAKWFPVGALAASAPPLPELTEPDVVRHFTNLSTLNMSIDTHFYPLGSCTMKYNPKRNERIAAFDGLAQIHPYQPEETVQGMLQLLYGLQDMLAEISGLPVVSLQPAAGAHGELTALMLAAAYYRDRGEKRTTVLAPDSAHGTNPASARMAGFDFETIPSCSDGRVDIEKLKEHLNDQTAVFMITNPSTLGLFDDQVQEISDLVHQSGGLIYLDGANMNAILGITRPGDFGADMMHFNPHKTFSGPHGGGGPGAGPICVTDELGPYLPKPLVGFDDSSQTYFLDNNRPKSIGRVRSFFGNVGVLVRAYSYILSHGPVGLKRIAENAVLNANYLLSQVKGFLDVPLGNRCMHEFVASVESIGKQNGLKQPAMDIAKRLLDYGYHPPTVYFPLTVHEAMMMEPTETESKQTLDAFAKTLAAIVQESPEELATAPHSTIISRPDEVQAARKPVMKWTPKQD